MAFLVVYDANVLYPNTLRDLLIRISQTLRVQYAAVTALVAQRIEHLTTDQKVGGSSPSERATYPQVRATFSGVRGGLLACMGPVSPTGVKCTDAYGWPFDATWIFGHTFDYDSASAGRR